MKKIKSYLINWLSSETVDIAKNKHDIMNLFKYSNFIELSVKERIELFKSVESEFYNDLAKENLDAEITIELVAELYKNK